MISFKICVIVFEEGEADYTAHNQPSRFLFWNY